MSSDESNEQELGKMAEKDSAAPDEQISSEEAAELEAEQEEATSAGEDAPAATGQGESGPLEDRSDRKQDALPEDQEVGKSQPEEPEAPEAAVGNETDSEDEDPFSEERIQRILDIELPVNVSFGSTKRALSEVLKLGPGALLELDRSADEPVVLKVNNKVFAKGEIVDVDGYYGVQITEISSPAQRIASLGD
jgi:flagellar motor switch protein FliN